MYLMKRKLIMVAVVVGIGFAAVLLDRKTALFSKGLAKVGL